MKHVDAATMMDLVEQRLSRSERELYERHFTDCADCAAEYEAWWTFLSGLGPSHLMDAPVDLIDECIAIYPKPLPPMTAFEKARILFDSFLQPLPVAGLRGHTSESRQMVIQVDDLDIHLSIFGKASGRTIQGQLLPASAERSIDGAKIQLRILGHASLFTNSDKLGEFRFNGVPAGSFIFFIELPSQQKIAQFSVQGE